MQNLDSIAERIHQSFEARNSAREQALSQARILTRYCSKAIRAIHRGEYPLAEENIRKSSILVKSLKGDLTNYPDLYHAGYTQDALKEYAEANIVFALTQNGDLPSPEELELEYTTYLKGLAEAVGELRRYCLDILRQGHSLETEHLLRHMDDIYAVLTTMDYPEAITGGLRHWTDVARSLIERTRGDITISLRQQHLEKSLHQLKARLEANED